MLFFLKNKNNKNILTNIILLKTLYILIKTIKYGAKFITLLKVSNLQKNIFLNT